MQDDKKSNIGLATLSLFSLKTKMIVIGVAIGIFLIVIVPVVAITSIFSTDEKQSSQKKGGGTSTSSSSTTTTSTSSSSNDVTTTVNEVISSESLTKYKNAKFPMPFETWNSNKDRVSSQYSRKRTITVNGKQQSRAHTGIDLVVVSKSNPKICAVLEGEVVVAKAGSTGYGNYVVLKHILSDNTVVYTLYGHMKQGSIMVGVGSNVQTGQVLGIMGSTGNSTGAHLHFEIRVGENSSTNAINPYDFLFGG